MKKITVLLLLFGGLLSYSQNLEQKPDFVGKITFMEYVSPLAERSQDLLPSDNSIKEAKDKRSLAPMLKKAKNKQEVDDFFFKNKHELEQSIRMAPPSLVFDAYASGSQPTDPSLAIGPNHVFVVYNTGFTIYDKSGNQLVGQTAPNPAIFPSGGCCDLTVSYDNAADRWVLSFLGNGAQIAVSDGPNPITSGWYVYTISNISDYQKLSVWSDGYYITENTSSSNKVWALERDALLAGDPNAQIAAFSLPSLVTSGFHSPQVLNVTDNNQPASGGATVVYMQDDAWSGVSSDHIKLWTIDMDWNSINNSTVSNAQIIPVTPFIGVFDNGSFSNLRQPGGGRPIRIDALQATIMNQAQFRKFGTHNSALFNFVVDVDASSNKLAGVRWYEFRQNGDNQPWSLYQEGTYTAPDNRHAWNASLAMDSDGNIGMGYTSMSSESSSSTIQVSSYFTGRGSSDPLGVMTSAEEVIANGNAKIPGTRYGDYSKIDVDPSDNSTFWFITEYMNNGRKGVIGKFQISGGSSGGDTEAPTVPTNLSVSNITANSAQLNWNASTDNIGVTLYNVFLDGTNVGSTSNTTFDLSGLSASTAYNVSVNAQDAAGNTSNNATNNFTTLDDGGNTGGEIAAYYFETGFQGWTDGGNDCARQATSNSFEGTYSIRLRDDSNSSFATSPQLNLSGNSQITIEFHTYANSMENGEDYFVEFFNGSSFEIIGQYVSGTDFNNGSFFTDTIVLNSANFNFTTNNRFRIRCDASANNDQIWFDQVIISGDSGLAPNPIIEEESSPAKSLALENKIKIFPNPARNTINISSESNYDQIVVMSYLGKVMEIIDNPNLKTQLNISNYSNGVYFIQFIKGNLATTKKFIKK